MVEVTKKDLNSTLTFTVTALSTKLDPILDKWAEYAYNHGFGVVMDGEEIKPFADLTNTQKFATINARFIALALAEANAQEDTDSFVAKEAGKIVHDLEEE